MTIVANPQPLGAAPGFSEQEKERRWAVLRTLMDESDVDLLIVFPQYLATDALWISGQPGAVLFPRDGAPQILLGGEDVAIERDRPPAWIEDRTFVGLANVVPWGAAVAERVQKLALSNRRVAFCGMTGDNYLHMHNPEGYLSYTTVQSVLDALPASCTAVNGTSLLARARYVKSDEEIAVIQNSVAAGERLAERIHLELKPGRSQATVYATALLSLSETLPMLAWCPGQWGEPRTRFVGPPPGAVEDGLYISTEIAVPVRGYLGQVAQCYVVGAPNEQAARLFDVNLRAFEAARSAMRPGATWGDVVEAAKSSASGSGSYVEFIMHGSGSGPLITPYNSHEAVKDDPLLESTTFILKPSAVPEGEQWIARNWDVSWGDMVVVRPEGAERLGTRKPALLETT
jgi:Xaa-Pro dipeptidase